jgi:hypothetical protein
LQTLRDRSIAERLLPSLASIEGSREDKVRSGSSQTIDDLSWVGQQNASSSSAAMASGLGEPSHLLPAGWTAIVTSWFQEDCPSFDYGGFVVGETPETATLFGKSKVKNNSDVC